MPSKSRPASRHRDFRWGPYTPGRVHHIWLLEASANLHDVRDFLGHANITTTSRYLKSAPVRLAQALERMEASAAELDDADERLQRVAVR